jgi:chromosome partitioning protein
MAGRVITIAQQKGGAGKTTLAVHLALAWHALGRHVTLIDIDPQGSLTRWFQLREQALGRGAAGVDLSTVTGWRAPAEIERQVRTSDFVIVDSPPHAQTDAKIAIRAAHLVVVPVQPSPLDIWATKATVDLAASENKKALLVLNRVPSRSIIAEEMAAAVAEIGADLAQARFGNRGSFAASMADGRTVGETAPGTVAAREAAKLAREILDLVRG